MALIPPFLRSVRNLAGYALHSEATGEAWDKHVLRATVFWPYPPPTSTYITGSCWLALSNPIERRQRVRRLASVCLSPISLMALNATMLCKTRPKEDYSQPPSRIDEGYLDYTGFGIGSIICEDGG